MLRPHIAVGGWGLARSPDPAAIARVPSGGAAQRLQSTRRECNGMPCEPHRRTLCADLSFLPLGMPTVLACVPLCGWVIDVNSRLPLCNYSSASRSIHRPPVNCCWSRFALGTQHTNNNVCSSLPPRLSAGRLVPGMQQCSLHRVVPAALAEDPVPSAKALPVCVRLRATHRFDGPTPPRILQPDGCADHPLRGCCGVAATYPLHLHHVAAIASFHLRTPAACHNFHPPINTPLFRIWPHVAHPHRHLRLHPAQGRALARCPMAGA